MARRLADAGVEVRAWGRSGGSPLEGSAATIASSSRDAVAGADVVFSMVQDDAASRSLWLAGEGALAHVKRGAVLIECSTLTPTYVSELAAAAERASVAFVDVPVVGSRPQAEAGSLVFLAGGRHDVIARVEPLLRMLGAAVHHVGPTPAAAYAKLVVNTLFGVQVAAVAELLAFAARAGVERQVLLETLGGLPVWSGAAKAAAVGMVAGRFEPMFPVALASKDLRYALAAAEAVGARLPVGRSASQVFEAADAEGLGGENLTAVFKLYR
jgi:3-hydroxyisobutyrate dehydrogenase